MELQMPAPLSHPPSKGVRPATAQGTHPQKYVCEYKRNSKILWNQFLKSQEKSLANSFFGISEFVELKIW